MLPKHTELIPVNSPNRPGILMSGGKPSGVVIHYTANYSSSADDIMHSKYVSRPYKKSWSDTEGKFKYYESNGAPFTFGAGHIFVGADSYTEVCPTNEVVYHVGDRNLPYDNGYKGQTRLAYEVYGNLQNYKTIGYELCINSQWDLTVANSIPIVAADIVKYSLDVNHIHRHYDLTAKICPAPMINLNIRETDPRWVEYKKAIVDEVARINNIGKANVDWKQVALQYLYDIGMLKQPHQADETVNFKTLAWMMNNYLYKYTEIVPMQFLVDKGFCKSLHVDGEILNFETFGWMMINRKNDVSADPIQYLFDKGYITSMKGAKAEVTLAYLGGMLKNFIGKGGRL